MRTRLSFAAVLLTVMALSQNRDCTPHPGIIIVCDSIRNMCRVDAHYLTMLAVSKPASQWYDSIRYPHELEYNYTNALCALYNDLPDSLADFRMCLRNVYSQASSYHPDSISIVTITIPATLIGINNDKKAHSGNWRVDSVLDVAGMKFVGYGNGNYVTNGLLYQCPPDVNRAWVERYLKKIHTHITLSPVPKFRKWRFMIDIDEGPDYYTITMMETSKCMPPELMCTFIKRRFTYLHEWGARYSGFERGIVPWPLNADD